MNVARYRRDYDGEFILLETKFSNNKIEQRREWVPNVIVNDRLSDRAAVIGSDVDIHRFDYRRLQNHHGGLLGSKRLQTYGSGDLWTKMRFDFFVTFDSSDAKSMVDLNYVENVPVFTSSKICINHAGKFYPIPYLPVLDQLALAVYLAAFDGHKEIFLLGYNNDTPAGTASWQSDVNLIMKTYDSTKFWLIGVAANMPSIWKANSNVDCMGYWDFVSYCDV